MKYIDYTVQNRKAYITLNRPGKRNALSHELVAELKEAFHLAEKEDQAKVVILKANGEAFCSGADLAHLQQLQNFSHEENLADSNHLKELFLQIYSLKKVVIAQVQGHALAGGCGLATVCDFIFAVPEAKFGYTEVKIGFIPAIVMVFLLRKIGLQAYAMFPCSNLTKVFWFITRYWRFRSETANCFPISDILIPALRKQ